MRGVQRASMSSAVPRAISQKVLPVTGLGFSKYWLDRGTRRPPIQWSYREAKVVGLPGCPG